MILTLDYSYVGRVAINRYLTRGSEKKFRNFVVLNSGQCLQLFWRKSKFSTPKVKENIGNLNTIFESLLA